MTTWTKILNQSEVEDISDVIVEGRVLSIQENLPIPGTTQAHLPDSPSVIGTKWNIEVKTTVKQNDVGKGVVNRLSEFCFWTLPGQLLCKVGEEIRASLVRHLNPNNEPVLMPQHCSYFSVVSTSNSKSLLTCSIKTHAPPIRDLPVVFDTNLFSSFPHDVITDAIDRWRNVGGPEANHQTCVPSGSLPCMPRGHYNLEYETIPPVTNNADCGTLAYAVIDENGRRPVLGSRYAMRFDKAKIDEGNFDFLGIVMHEMGHAYGLDHLRGNNMNVMYPTFDPGVEQHTLQQDDINAINQLYSFTFTTKEDRKMKSERVYKVTNVEYAVEKGIPPNLLVTAYGKVSTGGWKYPTLLRRVYVNPPADGIWEYDLIALPPGGPATQIILPVKAADRWEGYDQRNVNGIRVYSQTNCFEINFEKRIAYTHVDSNAKIFGEETGHTKEPGGGNAAITSFFRLSPSDTSVILGNEPDNGSSSVFSENPEGNGGTNVFSTGTKKNEKVESRDGTSVILSEDQKKDDKESTSTTFVKK